MNRCFLPALGILGANLLAGCSAHPEVDFEPASEVHVTQNALTQSLLSLDAQVAAGVGGAGVGAAAASPEAKWHTGLMAPGAQQHWYWNNAASSVYKIGFSPSSATSAGSCQFKLIRSWDVQHVSGEREFHFIIQNTGSISCSTNILLQSQAVSNTWSISNLGPGASETWTWFNANPLTAAHFVNISPTGANSSGSCQQEVTRSWYSQQPGGERRFHFVVKNVGSIACGGTVLLATNTAATSSWSTGTLAPGASTAWFWNNANPRNRVYVPGISPSGASGGTSCQLELLPTSYLEQLNADETSQRRFYVGVKNVGSISCSGTLLLNSLDVGISNPLAVDLIPQQTNMWCWAASAEMVMHYLGGHSVSQCDQANKRLSRSDCCDSPTPMGCVLGGWPEFEKYGFSATMTTTALSWNALKAQIDTKHAPYPFSWHWNDGGGHMMVVIGYKVVGGQNWVTIHDPWAPNEGDRRDILYADYVSGSTYSHWRDYYDVSKN